MPGSIAATTAEQNTSQVDQQNTEPAVLISQTEIPGETGSLSNQAHVNGIAPIVEDNQKEAVFASDVDQITRDPQNPPAAVVAAQPASTTEVTGTVEAQADDIPEVTSAEPTTKEAAVEGTPEEQTSGASGTESALESSPLAFVATNIGTAIHLGGVDLLHVDKVQSLPWQ